MLQRHLLLLAFLDVSFGDIQDLVADCTDFRRCNCAKGVSGGTPAFALVTNTKTKKHCTGVLINDRYLLSTADCGAGVNASQLHPALLVSFYDDNVELDVNRIYLHPNYVPGSLPRLYDIMLIRLSQLVDMSVHVPICLPHASLMMYDDATAWIMEPDKKPLSVKINTGRCSFTQEVDGVVQTIRIRTGMFLCGGNVKTSFCSIQPGYLLVMMIHGWYMVLGISSTPEVFPMCSYSMGLFSEVLPYRAWIRNITSDGSKCQFVQ